MYNRIRNQFQQAISWGKEKLTAPASRTSHFVNTHPFISLFSLLGIFLVLIVLGNILSKPVEKAKEEIAPPKKVRTYQIGEAPTMTVQAKVEKSGAVTITALAPGVVQRIMAEPGTIVTKGQTLISTSTNYQGGNAAYLQTQIAKRQLENIEITTPIQKDLIAKQKDLAEQNNKNAEELRSITQKSIDETKNMITISEDLIKLSDVIIADLEATNASNTSLLTQKNTRAQLISTNNQLRSTLRNNEYQVSGTNPQATMSNLQKDITLKQLELQEKTLDLSRDIAKLQLQLTQIQAATMYPSSPFNATVQRVLVKVGEAVNPGTPLVILSQEIEEDPIVAIALVSREVAFQASYEKPSTLALGDKSYSAYPSYISRDAVQGTLYAIYFPIPDEFHGLVTDDGYITVTVPVGKSDTSASSPFVPIDSVYQTQEDAYVYLFKDGQAVSHKIRLGTVLGRFVAVSEGLTSGDVIILDRNVVGGDRITPIN